MTTMTETSTRHYEMLEAIKLADRELSQRYSAKMSVNSELNRALVSFQANKTESGYRWCKYREGFSAELIRYLIEKTEILGTILDPFAGSGTALFVAAELGINAIGIELLPCSAQIIEVRRALLHADKERVVGFLRDVIAKRDWIKSGQQVAFPHLRITAGAFPAETEQQLGRFLFDASQVGDELLSQILSFAALTVLEEISFTRKDGQYLRWDQRSGRCLGKKDFDKGRIYDFDEAIVRKLKEISADIDGHEVQQTLFPRNARAALPGCVDVKIGSCLDILPKMKADSINGIITSPPYCNRYDYTRTYALELAMLNVGEDGIRQLRQAMLSCTVENKDKCDLSQKFGVEAFDAAMRAHQTQRMLQLVLDYLEICKNDKSINNPGIVRMIRNYFLELALLIFASARVLKTGAPFIMVNDNVRYEGAHVPVDLILSDFAEQAGFEVEAIWVLPTGKGNSSQQMGKHGRQEIRKCVYIWRKSR